MPGPTRSDFLAAQKKNNVLMWSLVEAIGWKIMIKLKGYRNQQEHSKPGAFNTCNEKV